MPTELESEVEVQEHQITQEVLGTPPGLWSQLRDLISALRPHHWIKNGFVLLPILFARKLWIPSFLIEALLTVAAFCLMSSGMYLLNDIVDKMVDRQHPRKRYRPIASGRISSKLAIGLAILFLTVGLLIGFLCQPWVGVVLMMYGGVQTAYCLFLKRVVILDVLTIATGFLLRVVAGAVVSGVAPSHWILLTSFLLALFLGFSKRRGELVLVGATKGVGRQVLTQYTRSFLDQVLTMLAGTVILCYSLYTVSESTVGHFGTTALMWTIPFVIYGILRYLYLIHTENGRSIDSPTVLLLTDKSLWLCIVLWGFACLGIVYTHFF